MKHKSRNLFAFIFLMIIAALQGAGLPDPEIVNENNIDRILSARGFNVVFINVWATWCKPCKEEFPDIIRLYREFSGKGVNFVSINVDYPDEKETKVIPFLRKTKTPFKVHIQNFNDNQLLINRIHRKWNGAIPFTLILNKHGKISSVLPGKKDYRQFREAVISAASE